jgi:hypothetical protein
MILNINILIYLLVWDLLLGKVLKIKIKKTFKNIKIITKFLTNLSIAFYKWFLFIIKLVRKEMLKNNSNAAGSGLRR